jgi:ribosomal protein L18E
MKKENSRIQKSEAANNIICGNALSIKKVNTLNGKIKRCVALFAVCALLIIACMGLSGLPSAANKYANNYALAYEYSATEAGDDNTATDENTDADKTATDDNSDTDEVAIKRIAIASDWQFTDKVPLLQDLPEGASVTYAVHKLDGNVIQTRDINDNEKYYVTATLTGDSAKSYYFSETGDNAVSMFFVYRSNTDAVDEISIAEYSPIWAILIISLALVGFIIALIKIILNVRGNAKDKKEQSQTEKTSAFAGTALLAFLGLDVKVWMILAFIAVALFFIGVIVMLLTWRHHIVSHVANTATHIYVNNNYHYMPPVAAAAVDEEEEVVEAIADKRKRNPSNFRVRLKASSDKCKDYYVQLKNFIAGYREVGFRMVGNTERVIYNGEALAYIGTTKRSLKLWLALNPKDYDEEVYHHKDVSDKKRYELVPMLVKVGSNKALSRAEELIESILAKYNVEQKVRYTGRNLQLLAYTLARNALVKDKRADLLRMSVHVHDADVLTSADAEKYTEIRKRAEIDKKNFATINLDILDSKFLDGQRITLDKLKKKQLVPEECNGVKITGGTRLTKPLYVVADEYTQEAVKMIVLTGGRAIKLIEPIDTKAIN